MSWWNVSEVITATRRIAAPPGIVHTWEHTMTLPPTVNADFLFDYLEHVERACAVLQESTGDPRPFLAWKEGRIDREGRAPGDPTITWRFHTAGCEVQLGDVVLDMAAGPDGRMDGLDLPRLSRFVRSRGSVYKDLHAPAAMRRAFEALKAQGVVRCPRWNPGVQLNYLSSSIQAAEVDARPAA